MLRKIFAIALTLGLALGGPALAKEYNKRPHLPPSAQAKDNSTRAQIFDVQDQEKRDEQRANAKAKVCFDPARGIAVDRSNPRREVVVATKDIVNLGGRLDLRASCQ